VWLPANAVTESKPLGILSLLTLALMLAKELSGETAAARAEQDRGAECAAGQASPRERRAEAYARTTRRRFDGINRCC
jgi:hypothetical protein